MGSCEKGFPVILVKPAINISREGGREGGRQGERMGGGGFCKVLFWEKRTWVLFEVSKLNAAHNQPPTALPMFRYCPRRIVEFTVWILKRAPPSKSNRGHRLKKKWGVTAEAFGGGRAVPPTQPNNRQRKSLALLTFFPFLLLLCG